MNKPNAPSKRAKGFRIGKNKPGTSSQSVYLGKAEKIKKTLIHKAKLKKQRAKELAKAGYSTTGQQLETDHERVPEPGSDAEDDDAHVDLIRRRRPTQTSDPTAHTGASSSKKRKTQQDRNKSSDSLDNSINQASSMTSLPINQPKPSTKGKMDHSQRNDNNNAHPSSSSSSRLIQGNQKTAENHHHPPPHRASANTVKPHTRKTSRAISQHVNGQPKMNHRISKLLSKLEEEKEAH